MRHQITIENTGEVFACGEDSSVLRAMEQLGRKGIPVGCRNGGCGVCKVRVLSGSFTQQKASRAVLSEQEQREGFALACKAYPRSEMKVEVAGRMASAMVAGRCASSA